MNIDDFFCFNGRSYITEQYSERSKWKSTFICFFIYFVAGVDTPIQNFRFNFENNVSAKNSIENIKQKTKNRIKF